MSSEFDTVDRLHELVSVAAQRCRDHSARQYGAESETLAERVVDLGEELHLDADHLGRELACQSERLAAAVSRSAARPALVPAGAVGVLPAAATAPARHLAR
ncbi:hypothetical protein ACFC6L_16505 [Kitasatospora phosalacinea]|uniref:hypothetical protein n=1 Tax=Kitasatospora phosalacinea TaxID=2065 RepID=UPI0035E1775F